MLCNTKILFALHLSTFLYPLSFFMHLCSSAALAEELSWNLTSLAHVHSLSRFLLAIGAPFFGRYGDLYGSTKALRFALASGVLSYLLAVAAVNETFLYVSRIPLIFSHAYQGMQMVVTHFSCKRHRANSLARLSLVFRAGLLAGPLVASQLLKTVQPLNVLMLSFVGAVVTFVVIHHFLPDILIRRKLIECCFPIPSFIDVFDVWHILKIQMECRVLLMTFIKIFSALPAILLQYVIYQMCLDQLEIFPNQQKKLLIFVSFFDLILHAIAVIVVHFVRNDIKLLVLSVVQLFFSYLIIASVDRFMSILIASAFLACGLVLLNLAARTILTKIVCDTDIGTVLGLFMMKDLLASLFFPQLQSAGSMQVETDPHYIGRFGVIFTGIVIILIVLFIKPKTAAFVR